MMEQEKIKSYKAHIEDINKEKGIVTIAISKFNVRDAADDIVRKGAFKKTFHDQGAGLKHVIDHSLKVEDIIGCPIRLEEIDNYAIIESALALKNQKARDVFELYKHFADNGRTLEHSYRYRTIKRNVNLEIKGEDIAELALLREYSTVAAGCNSETPLLGLKSYEQNDFSLDELLVMLKQCNISDEMGNEIEKLITKIKNKPQEAEPTVSLTSGYGLFETIGSKI